MEHIKIISREEWKALPSTMAYKKHYPSKVTIHHEGAANPSQKVQGSFKGAETIRNIQRYHQKTQGWSDIGYHALIAPNGDIYQGRPFDVVGAHTKSNNTNNIGICIIGNFEVEQPTKEQISALKSLLKYLSIKFPQLDFPKCLYGHKDFMSTDCPGKNLYPTIFEMKTEKVSWYPEIKEE